ncbi:Anti-sigma factor antagonist [Rhodovastum atsumiense]|uniref:Anti-sigma factor antagonist n=1 Tax=Rhodovastum atsumiense TaxID=504468 RepID=A0A5M6IYK0_9PROT|nr:STAS domain-containing protein [Rhodovastum atsumiense]KAA5613392.1 STAS domain-containing protein [Rhodovastum atsumiense]CAH2603086.1 Anti-sigma factor antagonist [Rhodovastum atsumiense]
MDIKVNIRPEGTEVSLSGKLTFAAHAAFRTVVTEHVDRPGGQAVTLDLGGIEYIDSAGLGMLLLAREAAQKHGRAVILRGARAQVARILSVSKFDLLFGIRP